MSKRKRNQSNLPPDPEGMNDRRAGLADAAIAAFLKCPNVDQDDAMCDLLADLMHWADRNGCDFDAALERASYHYDAETSSEPE